MMALLGMMLVLTTFGGLVMFAAGKETALTGIRCVGAGTLYVAEGGAVAGRAALVAYMNAYPVGGTSVDPSLTGTTVGGWYAGGAAASQNPFAVLDYLITDGQRFTLGASPATTSETFQVNWGLSTAHLKLQTTGTPTNSLGNGAYSASVVLQPNPTTDPVNNSCSPAGSACAIHQLGTNTYEIFYTYTVTADGTVGPFARRRVTLSGNFSIQIQPQNFAVYALFTDVHLSPTGGAVWFQSNSSFDGPVHTNGEFRFAYFPTFTDRVESVSPNAWFNNSGTPTELPSNANVSGGVRIDAPLVPPNSNPQSAPPANFSRGAPTVPLPAGASGEQAAAIGMNPAGPAPTTAQIAASIPELTNSGTVPNGIYVPVVDNNGNCSSDSGKPMGGGIYVQGNLDGLTMSLGGGSNNLAVYTLTQGTTTTTVTVDRANNQTTVTSNGWLPPATGGTCPGGAPGPATRTFTGVPKGVQAPGNANATIITVQGSINSLRGTLQQNEQTTIAATDTITIQGNLQYQTAPTPSNPNSNPTNLLGLYSSGGDIVIGAQVPNNVIIQAVLMAGSTGSTYNSSVNVSGYNTGAPRGAVNLLGGVVEKRYGAFGTFSSSTGAQLTGYTRSFTYDTRMSRGFAPPYFPTTNQFVITAGSQKLAGVKASWREATPP